MAAAMSTRTAATMRCDPGGRRVSPPGAAPAMPPGSDQGAASLSVALALVEDVCSMHYATSCNVSWVINGRQHGANIQPSWDCKVWGRASATGYAVRNVW